MKICVYAICKNESKFVKRWLDSMQEADYIVVLDTGSTDNTVELLQNDERVTVIESKTYENWRFDTARNDSILLIPEDTDICVCTDLDEVFEPGWANIIRENYNGEDIIEYRYVWSHRENGENDRVYKYEKIHKPGFSWAFPVHEYIKLTGEETRLNLYDKITLHHYPDQTKERNYLDLIKQRVQEDKDDLAGRIYLVHELNFKGLYQESNEQIEEIFFNYIQSYTPLEISNLYFFYAKNLLAIGGGPISSVIDILFKGIEANTYYCENYLLLAKLWEDNNLYHLALGILKTMEERAVKLESWLETEGAFTYRFHDLLSIAYYYTGNYKDAYKEACLAYSENPTDKRLKENKAICFEKWGHVRQNT